MKDRAWIASARSSLRTLLDLVGLAGRVAEPRATERRDLRETRAQPGANPGDAAFGGANRRMQAGGTCEDALGIVRHRAAALFCGCSGSLYLAHAPGEKLKLEAFWGRHGATCGDCLDAATCVAMRRGGAHRAADVGDTACAHGHQPACPPRLCVPIEAQGTVLGLLVLEESGDAGSLAPLRAVAANFSDQVGLALARTKLRHRLHRLSGRDPLVHVGLHASADGARRPA